MDAIYTGHLHFAGQLKYGQIYINFLSLCVNTARKHHDMGSYLILDTETMVHRYFSV